MDKIETRNAIITSAEITSDDHGCLCAWLSLDYGGSGQGFGGYALYVPKSSKHYGNGLSCAGHFIWRVMEVAGVTKWSALKGKTVRAKCSWDKVHAIGHIVKADWFNPSEDFQKMTKKEADENNRPV